MGRKTKQKVRTWYYHPEGLDCDGNGGPLTTDPGWIVVRGRTAEEAVERLPAKAKKKVLENVKEFKCNGDRNIFDVMGSSCGWGWSCSFLTDADWETQIESEEES